MIDTLYQCVAFYAFLFGGMYIYYRCVRKPGDKFFM